jgi:uncharacterized protein (UPF0276 family)
MRFNPPRLGPGAIYLRSLDALFRSNKDLIKVAEIEPQIFWTKPSSPAAPPRSSPLERRYIAAMPQHILTHGVGFPVGGTICDHENHVVEFRMWNRELASPWTSEHLSILFIPSANGPRPCGFLMPPVQTDSAVKLAVQNIRRRAAVLGLPFAFETGVNYFLRRNYEMPDGEFFAAIAEQADCVILLDLTNLWSNQKNGRAKVADVVAKIPLERVWEVHLAGLELEGGFWVDAHSRGIDPDLVAIARDIISDLPNVGAIVFELAPDRVSSFGEIAYLKQMETLNLLWERAPRGPLNRQDSVIQAVSDTRPTPIVDDGTPEIWERVIARQMLPLPDRPAAPANPIALTTEDEKRFSLSRHLAASFRSGALADLIGNSIRLLLLAMGRKAVSDLLDRYIAATPPVAFPTDEVLQFRQYISANPVPIHGFEEMFRFEVALIEAAIDNTTVRATFMKDIDTMLADLAAGVLPGSSSDRTATVLEIGVDPVPFIRICVDPDASQSSASQATSAR